MNKHRSNFSAMSSFVSVDHYNNDVAERDDKTATMKDVIISEVKACGSSQEERRSLFVDLCKRYPLYESDITSVIHEYWR